MADSKLDANTVLGKIYDVTSNKISVDIGGGATLGQATMAASSPVVIASNQSAVPISAASLPLPTGAATSAKQDGVQATLTSMDTKLGNIKTTLDNSFSSLNTGETSLNYITSVGGSDSADITHSLRTNTIGQLQVVTVQQYKTNIDEFSATVTYIGRAVPGAATSAASWQVSKFTTTGTVVVETNADGDLLFNNIWDNRTSLTYT